MKPESIQERTFRFGVNIIHLVKDFPKTSVGFALSSQIIRSATSIGANIAKAQDAVSRADFTHSINISLKEARETEFWLKTIIESKILPEGKYTPLLEEIEEIVKILRASLKKLKNINK